MGVFVVTLGKGSMLRIGSSVIWKGREYEIVGEDGHRWILVGDKFQKAFGVPKREVERFVEDVFEIGDRVRSKYSFRGRVVGFEQETNRVICVSDKIGQYTDRFEPGDGDRVRYSYGVNEVFPITEVEFEINRIYTLTQQNGVRVDVRAMEPPVNGKDSVHLYRVDNGKFYKAFPNPTDLYDLKGHNILGVELHD